MLRCQSVPCAPLPLWRAVTSAAFPTEGLSRTCCAPSTSLARLNVSVSALHMPHKRQKEYRQMDRRYQIISRWQRAMSVAAGGPLLSPPQHRSALSLAATSQPPLPPSHPPPFPPPSPLAAVAAERTVSTFGHGTPPGAAMSQTAAKHGWLYTASCSMGGGWTPKSMSHDRSARVGKCRRGGRVRRVGGPGHGGTGHRAAGTGRSEPSALACRLPRPPPLHVRTLTPTFTLTRVPSKLGFMVRGRPNASPKKASVGRLHRFTHRPWGGQWWGGGVVGEGVGEARRERHGQTWRPGQRRAGSRGRRGAVCGRRRVCDERRWPLDRPRQARVPALQGWG